MRLLAEITLVVLVITALFMVAALMSYFVGAFNIPATILPLIHLLYAALFAFMVSVLIAPFVRQRGR